MAKHPNLKEIEEMLDRGNDFELTETKYEKKTGAPLPKKPYYIVKGSALARLAATKGYELSVVEKTVIFKKKRG